MTHLRDKTIVVTGASRGIGKAIALRCAAAGANIVVLSKDSSEKMVGVERAIATAGGQPLVLSVDVTDYPSMHEAILSAVRQFGGVDILVNNTSATCFAHVADTTPEQFDRCLSTSVRAAFFLSQCCLPYLRLAANPHIVNISPPLLLDDHWFRDHLAFTIAKYSMSMCTIGMAAQFQEFGIAVNSLWPQTTVATQTIEDHFVPDVYRGSRWPTMMGEAAYAVITSRGWTGRFFTDEGLLREMGETDFSRYAVDPSSPLMQALFVAPSQDNLTRLQQGHFK